MDIIEEVIACLQLQSTVFCRMTLSGRWGFAKDALPGVPFHIVMAGQALIEKKASGEHIWLRPGDMAIFPGGDAHNLLYDRDAPALPFKSVLASFGASPWRPGMRFQTRTLHIGDGTLERTVLISGIFYFGERRYNPLLQGLPEVMLFKGDQSCGAQATMGAAVALLDAELQNTSPGQMTVAGRLSDVILIYALRAWLETGAKNGHPGLLRGLADANIGRVLQAIHQRPSARWSLSDMAAQAGQSRSRFAAHFKTLMGTSPMAYVTDWRMRQAAQSLQQSASSTATIAQQTGYGSEVTFSKAFSKWAGCSPARYRKSGDPIIRHSAGAED
ncbi:hypothetical protein BTJ39_02645 [Izhakiella australiensis]|uniref:HTH araC/xylS-type domain-containing protein n=1 Tax=Izhakiella australiensis TaxID=1926881 RepID=A0A1S8YSB3_9GAMM|nr:AraC family transcriptional regulator [Izhakiella australiensis]OON42071.1 hypothetical protein BTJ39_02645 [Izhakiella australiensis]